MLLARCGFGLFVLWLASAARAEHGAPPRDLILEDASLLRLVDSDGDGTPDRTDTDDDGDGVLDSADRFPFDRSEQTDYDGDAIGDRADPDDDNDGVPDVRDA